MEGYRERAGLQRNRDEQYSGQPDADDTDSSK
jgi:hypothetical protein